MKNIILILLITLSLNAMDTLESTSQLKQHKVVFLAYEKHGCPWCSKYKYELEDVVKKYEGKVKFFRIQKGSKVAKNLRKQFGYRVIIYPMTYILVLDKNNELKQTNEIYGYQPPDVIEDIFTKELHIK